MDNKHFAYVDSSNRLSGTASDFSFNINLDLTQKYDSVVMTSALLPKSYYLITDNNNSFILNENGVDHVITIENGCYILSAFRTEITRVLNVARPPNAWTYVMSFPSIASQANTGKWTWTVTGNGGIQPSFRFTNKLFLQMGFHENTTNTFVNDTLTSTHVIKLQVEDTLYVCSDIVEASSSSTLNNVLQDIHASASPDFSTINYQCLAPEMYSKKLASGNKTICRFSVTNSDGEVINFNGLPVTFTLLIYKKNDYYAKMGAYLKYLALTIDSEKEEEAEAKKKIPPIQETNELDKIISNQ